MAKLEELFDRIVSARVVIDSPHRNQIKGKTYAVRIELGLPRQELVVSREPVADRPKAMTAACDTAKRRRRTTVERTRGVRRRAHDRGQAGLVSRSSVPSRVARSIGLVT